MSGRRLVWVLTPLLVAILALDIVRGVRRWEASRAVNTVRKITAKITDSGRPNKRLIARNIELLLNAEAISPVDVDLPIARGGQNLLLRRPQAAIAAFEHALVLEPRGEIYAYIGQAKFAAGRHDEAEEAFRIAVLLDRALAGMMHSFMKRRPAREGDSQPTDRPPATEVAPQRLENGDPKTP